MHEEVLVGFEAEPGGTVGITSFGGGDRRSPLWLSGPVEVRRSADTLVLATTVGRGGPGRRPCRGRGARRARRAAASGTGSWWWRCRAPRRPWTPRWGPSRAATPTSRPSRRRWTARSRPTSEVHVFVNPDVYDDLEPVGGQVVISHEATHLATGAPLTSGVPLWLLEGFADYVALHDVDLPITTTAGQIIQQVRADGRPGPPARPARVRPGRRAPRGGVRERLGGLPGARRRGRPGRAGAALRGRVAAARSSTGSSRKQFGLTEAELTARWRQRLQDLAAQSTDGA